MEFTIKLTPQEIQIIGNALGERPFKEVGALIAKLDAQLAEQQKPKLVPDIEPTEAKESP